MVNFGPRDTVPERYRHRLLHQHNPQVTLMRTTPDENEQMGRWIGERLNQMDAPVRFLLPEGGVSALDKAGGAFYDQAADAALFRALEQTVRQTSTRQLVRVPAHINDAAFVDGGARRLSRGAWRAHRAPQGGEVAMRFERSSPDGEIPRHGGARRADRRRRRRHRALGEVRGGRRHRPHRDLQFRPLPHGRARLARRPDGLRRRQRHRDGDGGRSAAGGEAHAGARRRERHRSVPARWTCSSTR